MFKGKYKRYDLRNNKLVSKTGNNLNKVGLRSGVQPCLVKLGIFKKYLKVIEK